MYFGRSVFQSVVERLQSESTAEAETLFPTPSPTPSPKFSATIMLGDVSDDLAEVSCVDPSSAYRNFELPIAEQEYEPKAETITADISPEPAPAPEPQAEKPDATPLTKDFSFLLRTSPADVKAELQLNKAKSVEALQRKRRKFARDNHPDMVPETYRSNATLRMTAANLLIDQEIKSLNLMSRLGC